MENWLLFTFGSQFIVYWNINVTLILPMLSRNTWLLTCWWGRIQYFRNAEAEAGGGGGPPRNSLGRLRFPVRTLARAVRGQRGLHSNFKAQFLSIGLLSLEWHTIVRTQKLLIHNWDKKIFRGVKICLQWRDNLFGGEEFSIASSF